MVPTGSSGEPSRSGDRADLAGRDPEGDARWRAVLTGDWQANKNLRRLRPLFSHLPSDPRCKLCGAPYGPPFGPIARLLGWGPWDKNPSLCGICLRIMERHLGGAEVEATLLFADLRGSTEIAERMSPTDYRSLVNAYYRIAARQITNAGGIVDKYLGDGVFAWFVQGFSGPDHARHAVDAGRDLLAETQAGSVAGMSGSLPLGIGIHTGIAYVGVVGARGDLVEFTALGDAVNLAERLSAAASGGELIISDAVRLAARSPIEGWVRRTVALKGYAQPVEAWSMTRDRADSQ